MKSKVIVAIVLSAVALMAGDKTTSSRSESFSISKDERHHTLTFTNFEAESEYSVSVGASGGKLVSASAPSGIMVTPTDQSELFSSATATKTAGTLPDSFNFVFSGYFRPDGDIEEGSDLPWDVEVGTKFYWIEASGYDEKDITVPEGTTVQYVARENGDSKKSNWTVSMSGGASQSKSEAASITFNRSFWGDIAAWFTSDQAVTTPVPGIYTITAVPSDNTSFSPAPSSLMTVVGAEFKQGNSLGWDDFSNWSKDLSDYYGSRNGKCNNPYIAVKHNTSGTAALHLTPSSCSKDIKITEDDTSIENLSPETTKRSTTVSFKGIKNWHSDEGEIDVELDGTTLATATVCAYNEKTVNVLVVSINGAATSSSYSCFSQAVVSVNQTTTSYSLSWLMVSETVIPINSSTSWSKPMLEQLRDDFYAANANAANYDHVQFHLDGTIASSRPGYIILGQADAIPARDSWISHGADTRTPPHELGHCMGLHHRNSDKDALMCQTAYASGANADKLRKVEWDDLH